MITRDQISLEQFKSNKLVLCITFLSRKTSLEEMVVVTTTITIINKSKKGRKQKQLPRGVLYDMCLKFCKICRKLPGLDSVL